MSSELWDQVNLTPVELIPINLRLKSTFMFSRKATKMDENGGEDFVNFFGLLRKHELYLQLQSTLETLSSSSS